MVSAPSLVNALLEAPINYRGVASVYVLGPKLGDGSGFKDVATAYSIMHHNGGLPAKATGSTPAQLDAFLEKGYTVILKAGSGFNVYSADIPLDIDHRAAERAKLFLDIPSNAAMMHYTSATSGKGRKVSVDDVFATNAAKVKNNASTAAAAPDAQTAPSGAKLSLRFTYTKGYAGPGVYVHAAYPKGPLALAGIHGGDVIVGAQYFSLGKRYKVRIDDADNLRDVLNEADDGKTMHLFVQRGSSVVTFPVTPISNKVLVP